MERRPLGRTGIRVSLFCLGSMTWGSQNTEAEAHAQIDLALDHGVNFIDTAEMYPTTPMRAETCGDTDRIIGRWLARSGRRAEVVIAAKVTGIGSQFVRDGGPITGPVLIRSVEDALKRLCTDYIDLFQLHWPNRGSYAFRQSWRYDPSSQPKGAAMAEHVADVLDAAETLIRAGKIRALGLSNETAWGVMQWLGGAAGTGRPRIAAIQNEYSLLARQFDLDLAEVAHHEDVGLLAYSPLAAGLLTGKYAGGALPAGSRATIRADLGGRMTEQARAAADAYGALARDHGLTPEALALAFVAGRPFTTAVILGATSLDQLSRNLAAARITLDQATLDGIAALHRTYPAPF